MGNVEVLLTIGEIEQQLGYSKGGLSSMRSKGYFPVPDQQYGRTPLWRQSTVDEWKKGRKGEQ